MTEPFSIIGLSGTNGAGKDTVGELLANKYGYLFISVSDLLRDELRKRGISLERDNMRALSAEWRKEHGAHVLVDQAIKLYQNKTQEYAGLAIASLRDPAEVDRLHELGGTLVWVDADPKVRYDRVQAAKRSGRPDDHKTFEQFIAEEKAEMTAAGNDAGLNMEAVKERADAVVLNNTTDMSVLEHAVENVLGLESVEK